MVKDSNNGDKEKELVQRHTTKIGDFVMLDDCKEIDKNVMDLFRGRHYNILPVLPRMPHPLEVFADAREQKMKLKKNGVTDQVFVLNEKKQISE